MYLSVSVLDVGVMLGSTIAITRRRAADYQPRADGGAA